MSYREKVIRMASENGGYLILREAVKAGIPTAILSRMAKEKEIERVAPGIYLLPEYLDDELYEISCRYQSLAFCRGTALYLQGLSNRTLERIEANFPSHFNASRLERVVCHYPNERIYRLGLTKVKTPFGHEVKGYNVERCLCDLFYFGDDFDSEERAHALRSADKEKIDYPRLLSYAEELKVERQIKALMEVIL